MRKSSVGKQRGASGRDKSISIGPRSWSMQTTFALTQSAADELHIIFHLNLDISRSKLDTSSKKRLKSYRKSSILNFNLSFLLSFSTFNPISQIKIPKKIHANRIFTVDRMKIATLDNWWVHGKFLPLTLTNFAFLHFNTGILSNDFPWKTEIL